ncbi:MAG: zinc ribbon domain-containing protein [Clostridia bacterium]|nr:zinc ribbon domain-containing protein [Clostridia bacterium]
MDNIDISQYAQQVPAESNSELYILLSVILFGGVLIFIGIYIYNFIQAYKTGNPNFKEQKELEQFKKEEQIDKQTERFVKLKYGLNEKTCIFCGHKNASTSKFCNECGKKLP